MIKDIPGNNKKNGLKFKKPQEINGNWRKRSGSIYG